MLFVILNRNIETLMDITMNYLSKINLKNFNRR